MDNTTRLVVIAVVVALATGLLTWLVVDAGSAALTRWRADFTRRTRFQAREFFLFVDPRKLYLANLAVMLVGAMLVWVASGSVMVAAVLGAALAMLPRLLYAWMRRRRLQRFEEQLPDALMMLAGALRAGVGLGPAIGQLVSEAPAPLGQEFALLQREQRLGVTLEQSLNNLGRRVPTPTTVLVVSAIRIATETGGGLAETLERTAHMIRSRLQMEGKIAALTAQGKLQAWVVGALPLVLMAILDRMEPEAMSHLWHSRTGWATLVVIATLEFLGIYAIRRIVAIDV